MSAGSRGWRTRAVRTRAVPGSVFAGGVVWRIWTSCDVVAVQAGVGLLGIWWTCSVVVWIRSGVTRWWLGLSRWKLSVGMRLRFRRRRRARPPRRSSMCRDPWGRSRWPSARSDLVDCWSTNLVRPTFLLRWWVLLKLKCFAKLIYFEWLVESVINLTLFLFKMYLKYKVTYLYINDRALCVYIVKHVLALSVKCAVYRSWKL